MTFGDPIVRLDPAPDQPKAGRRFRGRDIGYVAAAFVLLNVLASALIGAWPSDLESAPAFRTLAGTVVLWACLMALIYVRVRWVHGTPFLEEMRWSLDYRASSRSLVLLGMGMAFTVMLASTLFPPSQPPIERLLATREAVIAFAVFGVLFAPFLEELMFRGYLFRVVEDIASTRVAVPVTAVSFALLHVPQLWGSWAGMAVILGVGYLLSLLRQRTGSIVPPIIVHAAYNAMLFLAFAVGALVQNSAA